MTACLFSLNSEGCCGHWVLQPVLAAIRPKVGSRLVNAHGFLFLLTEMAQEEMEVDLQPVVNYSLESQGVLPAGPAAHTALPSQAAALSSGGGSTIVVSDDEVDEVVTLSTADAPREAAADPDQQANPPSALIGLLRLQGASEQHQLLPGPQVMQRPRVRRSARRQPRVSASQRTVSAR